MPLTDEVVVNRHAIPENLLGTAPPNHHPRPLVGLNQDEFGGEEDPTANS